MRYFLLLLWSLLPFFLQGEEYVDYIEPKELSSSEGLPSTLSNGTVCVISGEYVDTAEDLVLPGPETFIVKRTYGSQSMGCFGASWAMEHQEILLVENVIHEDERSKLFRFIQPSGAQIDYVCEIEEFKKKKRINPKLVIPKGLTNGAHFLSGRTNLKNQVIHYNTEDLTLAAVTGSGDRKIFNCIGKTKDGNNVNMITQEQKVNGSTYFFEWAKDHKKRISCKSAKTGELYSGVKFNFDYYTEKEPLVITASDGREIKYHFKQHKYKECEGQLIYDHHYLTKVESPYIPGESYSYDEKYGSKDLHIVLKKGPDGRFLRTSYYRKGDNSLGDKLKSIDIEKSDDYRLNRVKEQLAPVGTTHQAIPIHRYVYDCEVGKDDRGRRQVKEGTTDVYDAHNHKTTYSHDKNHRLTSIEHFSGTTKYERNSCERFIWGKKGEEEGNLLGKTFKDASGEVRHARYFTYDAAGNVLSSTLYGSLTGRPSPPIVLNKDKRPAENGVERDQKTYTYSQDGLNLCLSETDSNGKKTIYRYLPQTDRIRAKYIEIEGKIIHREFYAYNDHFALTQKIVDDGSALEKANLEMVTKRFFTDITPRKTAPFGLPEITEESYFDVKKKQKILLKATHFHYSKEGRLCKQEVFDADRKLSLTLRWEYDLHGNVISEMNAAGETIRRKYDASNNQIFEEGPSNDFAIHNTYDYANRLICQKEIHRGGKVFSTTHVYDTLSNCIATTNPYGEETRKSYNDFGLVKATFSPAVLNEKGEIVRPRTFTTYDAASLPISTIDPKGRETKTKYNIRGQPVEITHPDGSCETWIYELDGRLRAKTERTGIKTTYKRDLLGRVLKESVYGTDGSLLKKKSHRYNNSHLLETIDEAGNSILYTYDGAGRLISTKQGDRLEQNVYDSLGRLSEVRTWYGSKNDEYKALIKIYDLLDRVVEERVENADGTVLQKSSYAYDARGNQTFMQMGEVQTTTTYDIHNNPIAITNGLGETTHITYDNEYKNKLGQKVLQTTTTDPLGYQTIDTYDAANRLVDVTRKNPLGSVVAHQETYFDLLGNPARVMSDVIEKEKVQRSLMTLYTYTIDNQVASIIEAAGTPEQKITRTTYNELGQKSATIKPDGTIISYNYDPLGRVKKITSSDQTIAYRYEYNVLDQITEVKDLIHGKMTTREYDSLGQMVKETLGNGLALSYTYDRMGRVCMLILPDNTGVEYVYDAVNLKEVHRLVDGKRVYTHRDVAHDLSGKVTESALAGMAGIATYAYDPLGRCIDNRSPQYHQSILKDGFDKAGNLLSFEAEGKTYSFAYDDSYHLVSETGHSPHTYQFDSLANRTAKDGEQVAHNGLNQIISSNTDQFIYDLNGNLSEWTGKSKVRYRYDALDRLIALESDGKTTTYHYDSFGRRLTKTGEEGAVLFAYFGQEEIGLWKEGVCKELRLLGKNKRSPMIALEIEGVAYVPIHDLSGNVALLLNQSGEVVERYRYTAFGESEIISPSGDILTESSVRNPWQYASKRLDEESGLVAFGLRYYSAELGRWITPDPAGFADGANLYAYVHNNPLLYWDQFGLYFNIEVFTDAIGAGYCMIENMMRSFFGSQPPQVKEIMLEEKFEAKHNRRHKNEPFEKAQQYELNQMVNPETKEPFNQQETPGKRVGFVNGIMNSFGEFADSLIHLGRLGGGNTNGVHSPTRGLINDLGHYFGAIGKNYAYEEVQQIHKMWYDFLETAPADATFLMIAHSRGAVYLRNALMAAPEWVRQRIEVIAIAPAGYIDSSLCKSIQHYVSDRDPIPLFDMAGRSRCRETITTLRHDKKANPFFDHSFTSRTYEGTLQREIKSYLTR